MNCYVTSLGSKDVINTVNAQKIGCVCDLEIDCCTGSVIALKVSGKSSLFSFGKSENICIPWKNVEKIGDDTILVTCDGIPYDSQKKKSFTDMFKL